MVANSDLPVVKTRALSHVRCGLCGATEFAISLCADVTGFDDPESAPVAEESLLVVIECAKCAHMTPLPFGHRFESVPELEPEGLSC
jgi:ribosomal protein S27E